MTDTSSGTDLADMSDGNDVMETEDEKEQALHCDEYNENLTGGVGDGAGVPKKKPRMKKSRFCIVMNTMRI